MGLPLSHLSAALTLQVLLCRLQLLFSRVGPDLLWLLVLPHGWLYNSYAYFLLHFACEI